MKNGFTLVELLMVIIIIAILSTLALTIYTSAQKQARDATRISSIEAIAQALEINYGKPGKGIYDCVRNEMFGNGNKAYKDPKSGNNYNLPGCSTDANCVTVGDTQTCSHHDAAGSINYTDWIVCANLESDKSGNQANSTTCVGSGTSDAADKDICKFCIPSRR